MAEEEQQQQPQHLPPDLVEQVDHYSVALHQHSDHRQRVQRLELGRSLGEDHQQQQRRQQHLPQVAVCLEVLPQERGRCLEERVDKELLLSLEEEEQQQQRRILPSEVLLRLPQRQAVTSLGHRAIHSQVDQSLVAEEQVQRQLEEDLGVEQRQEVEVSLEEELRPLHLLQAVDSRLLMHPQHLLSGHLLQRWPVPSVEEERNSHLPVHLDSHSHRLEVAVVQEERRNKEQDSLESKQVSGRGGSQGL